MKSQVRKWGNSFGIRIPKLLAKQVGIDEGTPVDIEVAGEKIEIKPSAKITLKELVYRITPENMHGEVDCGEPKGREEW
ncbi:MAG: antitoxin MazE [Clostridia bacterium]|nr:antitoxin MazE [Clostridia bacterium]